MFLNKIFTLEIKLRNNLNHSSSAATSKQSMCQLKIDAIFQSLETKLNKIKEFIINCCFCYCTFIIFDDKVVG